MSSSTKTSEQWASELASITPHILSAPAEQVESSISKPDAAFARYIDHTLLKPDATPAQIDALCDEALKYNFKVSPGAAMGVRIVCRLDGGHGDSRCTGSAHGKLKADFRETELLRQYCSCRTSCQAIGGIRVYPMCSCRVPSGRHED